ncbi:Fic family protein [Corynebacterium suedekumii]|nr:Fic family protein [Corynebacterium suedekumii]
MSTYQPFPSFVEWITQSGPHQAFDTYAARFREIGDDARAESSRLMTRSAAVDTNAIEGIYHSDRGFTRTIAEAAAGWEQTMQHRGAHVRPAFDDAMNGYQFILDVATGRRELSQQLIRELHATMTASQDTFTVETAVGPQAQALPHGQYKTMPNSPTTAGGTIHAYAPVEDTPPDMARLIGECTSVQFTNAHPVDQASYIHYALRLRPPVRRRQWSGFPRAREHLPLPQSRYSSRRVPGSTQQLLRLPRGGRQGELRTIHRFHRTTGPRFRSAGTAIPAHHSFPQNMPCSSWRPMGAIHLPRCPWCPEVNDSRRRCSPASRVVSLLCPPHPSSPPLRRIDYSVSLERPPGTRTCPLTSCSSVSSPQMNQHGWSPSVSRFPFETLHQRSPPSTWSCLPPDTPASPRSPGPSRCFDATSNPP